MEVGHASLSCIYYYFVNEFVTNVYDIGHELVGEVEGGFARGGRPRFPFVCVNEFVTNVYEAFD